MAEIVVAVVGVGLLVWAEMGAGGFLDGSVYFVGPGGSRKDRDSS